MLHKQQVETNLFSKVRFVIYIQMRIIIILSLYTIIILFLCNNFILLETKTGPCESVTYCYMAHMEAFVMPKEGVTHRGNRRK